MKCSESTFSFQSLKVVKLISIGSYYLWRWQVRIILFGCRSQIRQVKSNSVYLCLGFADSYEFLFFLFQVETELIDKLDILVSENKGDEEYKHLFNAM